MRRRLTAAAALAVLLPHALHGAIVFLHEDYEATPVTLPFLYTGGHIAADPLDENAFWIAGGFFQNHDIYRVVFNADGTVASSILMASGTVDVDMDGAFLTDNHFGTPTLFPLANGELIIADADLGSNGSFVGTLGETILRARDTNNDGRFTREGEVTELVNPHAFSGPNFTGEKGTVGPDGRLYVTTCDGGGNGEVLVFTASGAGLAQFVTELDRGYGIGFLADGRAAIADTNDAFNGARILLAKDNDSDGTATDPGEVETLVSGLPVITHLSTSGDGEIYAALANFGTSACLAHVNKSTGATTTILCVTPLVGSFQNFIPVFAFDSSDRPFSPSPNPQRALVMEFSMGGLQFISPKVVTASADLWALY